MAGGMTPRRGTGWRPPPEDGGADVPTNAPPTGAPPTGAPPTSVPRPGVPAAPATPAPVPPAPVASGHGDARHCWVLGLPEAPGRWPGLLVEWRRSATGWEGRVVLALPGPTGVVLVERWLDPVHLEPR